jgi:hydrogenase small subunit
MTPIKPERRAFLKKVYNLALMCGAATFLSFDDLLAMEQNGFKKPRLIWLHGTSCSGCSTSFLNVEGVSVLDLLTEYTQLLFHPDISSATGHHVSEILTDAARADEPHLLIVEGSIPTRAPHACMMGERFFSDWIELLGPNTSAAVAAGTCAAYGGITSMSDSQRDFIGPQTLADFFQERGIDAPVVNLPNCPLKPEHLVYVLFYAIRHGELPKLDRQGRPLEFYARNIHERCIFYYDYQENNFAKAIGEPGCLKKLGCQGPITKNDCLVNGHNGNTNICIRAGHPCIGCANELFPRNVMFHLYDDKRML